MLVVFPLPLYMSAVNRAGPLSFMPPPPSSLYERGQQSWSIVLHAPPSSLYERGQQSWSIVLHAPPPPLYMSAVNRAGPLSFMPPLPPPPFTSPRFTLQTFQIVAWNYIRNFPTWTLQPRMQLGGSPSVQFGNFAENSLPSRNLGVLKGLKFPIWTVDKVFSC